MNIRRFDVQIDYVKHSKLYEEWNLPVTSKTWIPEDTFIIEQNGEIVCAASLYQLSKTAMFWIEGIVTNKNVDKNVRKVGLHMLIEHLYKTAKQKGAEIVMSSTPREGLKETFENCGFGLTLEKYYHLGRF